jgi:membrane-bound serine protease (ClpP class)
MLTLGLLLLLAGLVLAVTEAHVTTGGLGAVAVLALAGGVFATVDGLDGSALSAVVAALIALTAGIAALTAVTRKVAHAQRTLPAQGAGALRGTTARVRTWDPARASGQVALNGELWRARLALAHEADDAAEPPRPGDPVVVEDVRDLTLSVRKAEPWEG